MALSSDLGQHVWGHRFGLADWLDVRNRELASAPARSKSDGMALAGARFVDQRSRNIGGHIAIYCVFVASELAMSFF